MHKPPPNKPWRPRHALKPLPAWTQRESARRRLRRQIPGLRNEKPPSNFRESSLNSGRPSRINARRLSKSASRASFNTKPRSPSASRPSTDVRSRSISENRPSSRGKPPCGIGTRRSSNARRGSINARQRSISGKPRWRNARRMSRPARPPWRPRCGDRRTTICVPTARPRARVTRSRREVLRAGTCRAGYAACRAYPEIRRSRPLAGRPGKGDRGERTIPIGTGARICRHARSRCGAASSRSMPAKPESTTATTPLRNAASSWPRARQTLSEQERGLSEKMQALAQREQAISQQEQSRAGRERSSAGRVRRAECPGTSSRGSRSGTRGPGSPI